MSRRSALNENLISEEDKCYKGYNKDMQSVKSVIFEIEYNPSGFTYNRYLRLYRCLSRLSKLSFDIGRIDNKQLFELVKVCRYCYDSSFFINFLFKEACGECNPKSYRYFKLDLNGHIKRVEELYKRFGGM